MDPSLALITESLARDARHPLATHLLIHLAEGATPLPSAGNGGGGGGASLYGTAALGEAAADALASAQPAMGHLVHMPSHLYFRVGRWHDAVQSNQKALEADESMARR